MFSQLGELPSVRHLHRKLYFGPAIPNIQIVVAHVDDFTLRCEVEDLLPAYDDAGCHHIGHDAFVPYHALCPPQEVPECADVLTRDLANHAKEQHPRSPQTTRLVDAGEMLMESGSISADDLHYFRSLVPDAFKVVQEPETKVSHLGAKGKKTLRVIGVVVCDSCCNVRHA